MIALRNCIARQAYCDNETSFHGVDNELRREVQQIENSKLQEKFYKKVDFQSPRVSTHGRNAGNA